VSFHFGLIYGVERSAEGGKATIWRIFFSRARQSAVAAAGSDYYFDGSNTLF